MSQGARVTSIDAIKKFRSDLSSFGDDARNALGAVEMEIRRTLDWLLHDQPSYWKSEIKRRQQKLSDAQADLFKKKLSSGDREANLSEQKEAIRLAKRRLEEAEDKLEKIKKWAPVVQHAVDEYHGRARPLGDMVAADLEHALNLLDKMGSALDAYIATAPPSMSSSFAVGGSSSNPTNQGSASSTTTTAAQPGEEVTKPAEATPSAEAAVGSQPSAVSPQPEKTEDGEATVRLTADG